MISNTAKLATVLGVAGVMAFSVASAEARDGHHRDRAAAASRGVVVDPYAYQLPGPQVYRPSVRDAYGYIDDGLGYSGTGTFSDGRRVPGTNWNPNQ
jgi:hypothetical protein